MLDALSTLTYTPRGYIVICMEKQKFIQRLKIIEGQVRGLQEMLHKNAYCIDVITQTSAVKRALSGVEDAIMVNHLATCVVDQMKKGKEGTAVKEILKVYKIKNR